MKYQHIFLLYIQIRTTLAFVIPPSYTSGLTIRRQECMKTCFSQSSTEENEKNDSITANLQDSSDKEITTESSSGSSSNVPESNDISNMTGGQIMAALGTSPRRIFLGVATSSAISLAADFGGITGKILSVMPEDIVESTGLDTYYPRGDYKRFKGNEFGYTFIYPKQWVGDTALELAKAQRRTRALDYTMKSGKKATNTLPDAAFGPPGKLNERGLSNSDTNVSVVASPLPPNFISLQQTLGTPEAAAETLLRVSLAPEGSGRKATLLEACEELRGTSAIYQFDYTVDRGEKGEPLRAISAIAVKKGGVSSSGVVNIGSTLITFTVVAPQNDWEGNQSYADKLKKMADSFKLS